LVVHGGDSCRICRLPLRVTATELFALRLTASFAASCLARTFLAWNLLQMPLVFIRYLMLRLEPFAWQELFLGLEFAANARGIYWIFDPSSRA
jgi:hypothetical protein